MLWLKIPEQMTSMIVSKDVFNQAKSKLKSKTTK
jgi:hypothetical protein